jgi:hypothetical protein
MNSTLFVCLPYHDPLSSAQVANNEALFIVIVDIFSSDVVLLNSIGKLSKMSVLTPQNCEIA